MPMPHDLLLQFLAAAATLVVGLLLFLVSATFIRVLIVRAVWHGLDGLWDRIAGSVRGQRYRSMTEHWRHYQDTVDSSMEEDAIAAFHKARAARARAGAWQRFHATLGHTLDSGSLEDPVVREAKVFVSYTTPDLIQVAKYLSGYVARGAVSPKPFLDFLMEERAEALRDPGTFRDHARRFRDRFGFSPFRLLKYLDEAAAAPT